MRKQEKDKKMKSCLSCPAKKKRMTCVKDDKSWGFSKVPVACGFFWGVRFAFHEPTRTESR